MGATKQPVKPVAGVLRKTATPLREFSTMQTSTLGMDEEAEFIAELSGMITKWNGRAGKNAIAYSGAYKNVLKEFLTPDTDE